MFLVFLMALLLVTLGYVVGEAMGRGGGYVGLLIAVAIWTILGLVAYFQGHQVALRSAGAKKIQKEDHPRLYNIVEEMTIASGLGKIPEVYVIDSPALNAFAAGRNPDNAVVAVTAGLLRRLNRDQLQGVIAHEIAHIKNRDILFMTLMGVMAGAIVIFCETMLRVFFYSSAGRMSSGPPRGGGGGGRGGGHPIMMIAAVVLIILAPILSRLLYLASSRKREYLADATAAVYTRYPEGLASALEAIKRDVQPMNQVNSAVAPMFIKNPLQKVSARGLFSTHPPLDDRIGILRSMGGAASFNAYQEAWKKVGGKRAGALPASALAGDQDAGVREASPLAQDKAEARHQSREAGDALRKANNFLFLACVCGLRVKIPPDFKKKEIECPRCHRNVAVPLAQMAAAGVVADAVSGKKGGGLIQQAKERGKKGKKDR